MDINEIYIGEIENALVKDHAALMVGAGFSKNAERVTDTDKNFLSWEELMNKLYEASGVTDGGFEKENSNLPEVAQIIEEKVGRSRLDEIIEDIIPDLEYAPSDIHVKLIDLPWKDIFTTNYDTLLERAEELAVNRKYDIILSQGDVTKSSGAPRIVKLHGSLHSEGSYIITAKDYENYAVEYGAFANTFRQALIEDVFCLIGFSCEDPNFMKWVEWAHDVLGEEDSNGIYMVSINHVDEKKRTSLLKNNISVIDLKEIWPDENLTDQERLNSFIELLKSSVDEKINTENDDSWPKLKDLDLRNLNCIKATDAMKQLNDSYPGWIFLPWSLKKQTILKRTLSKLEILYELDEISFPEQVNYMYEYVKFMDTVGRPISSHTAYIFWNTLQDNNDESVNDIIIQSVYLHLLRSFRETADWEKYDECHGKINLSDLDYDERQFFFTCDWWKTLYRFQPDDLVARLDNWNLDESDVYWPLIKGSMYALLGEMGTADTLLNNHLTVVRRQLKNGDDQRLLSIQTSTVSLINYIRLGLNKESIQGIHSKELSWHEENDNYCIHLNTKGKNPEPFEIRDNFDLSRSYAMHFGVENSEAPLPSEYLRFLEQTGHPFRLQNVVNNEGLHSTLEKLVPYYPHWCLMQVIISRDKGAIDYLFGRVQLAKLTCSQIDEITEEMLNAVQITKDYVSPENAFSAKSFFDQAAIVLPEIVARLCYKCSTNKLDEILDTFLEICLSDKQVNFKGIKKIFAGLSSAYTHQEAEDRLEKILRFPFEIDRANDYVDPLNYFDISTAASKTKHEIHDELYHHVIDQINQLIYSPEREKRESAIDRFVFFAQAIDLKEKDKEQLFSVLEQQKKIKYDYYMYVLDSERFAGKPNEIFHATLQRMQKDSDEKFFASSVENYEGVIRTLKGLNIQNVDIEETFLILENLVHSNSIWSQRGQAEANIRIEESFIIAVKLLILLTNKPGVLTKREKKQITEYFIELEKYLEGTSITCLISAFMGWKANVMSEDEFSEKILLCDKHEKKYITDFYNSIYKFEYQIQCNEFLSKYSNIVFQVAVYETVDSEVNNIGSILDLCFLLLENNITARAQLQVLLIGLLKIKNETVIMESDSEQDAVSKLRCRIRACQIASQLHTMGIKDEALNVWKNVISDENEFAEIRNVGWTDDADTFPEEPYEEGEQ